MTAALLASLTIQSSLRAEDDPKVRNEVQLVLQISGLGSEGAEIEIKPGHAACDFQPISRKLPQVAAGSVVKTNPILVTAESRGADRDCSFAITIKEPGKPARKYVRGVRLSPQVAGGALPVQKLNCYLSMTSIASTDSKTRTR
jgi:hypothetical protein